MKSVYTATLISIIFLAVSSVAYSDDDDDLEFEAKLSPAQEVVEPDPATVTIRRSEVDVDFSDDLSKARVRLRVRPSTNVTRAHFHCARAGQNGPIAFGLIDPGTFVFVGDEARGTLTNADFTGADCVPFIGRPVNNIAALAFAMRDGLIYMNVHTAANPGGEVRGQMLPDD